MMDTITQKDVFNPDIFALGETDQELHLDTRSDCQVAALSLVTQAQRHVAIISRDLDPLIYNNTAFADAISALARRGRQTQVQILIRDSGNIVRDGHRLIPLSQRLSSSILIRKIHRDFSRFNEAFLIADRTGFLHRPKADLYNGNLSFKSPLKARELLDTFDTIWNISEPDPELRRLGL